MGMTEVTRYYSSDPGATDRAAEDVAARVQRSGLEMWTYTASGVALTCRPGDREMHGILAAHGSF